MFIFTDLLNTTFGSLGSDQIRISAQMNHGRKFSHGSEVCDFEPRFELSKANKYKF